MKPEEIHAIARKMAELNDLPSMDDGLDEPMRWHGPYTPFRKWHALQDADMQARVRRVFPSLKVEL